jgi:DNA-directed RNA polymerase I and III subunit RPAC1
MPTITLKQDITDKDARDFQACFPKGVISIVDSKAVVSHPRLDTVSKECLRHPVFADKVVLGRDTSHYIWTVESTGVLMPHEIVEESFLVLMEKCRNVKSALDEMGYVATE